MSVIEWSPASWGALGPQSAGLARSFSVAMPPAPMVRREAAELPPVQRSRTRLWEIATWMHCSIVGTCLTTAELRQVLLKLGLATAETADHEAHKKGVTIAGRHDTAGKLLHKALDTRHRLTINQFTKARTEDEARALWKAALDSGEIPGAYWAVLTHPASERGLIADAFADVHMLSHLVGAANRADIRRLRDLENARMALEEKLARTQAALRDTVAERDATIRDLRTTLMARIATEPEQVDGAEARTLRRLLGEREARLAREAARRASVEQKLVAVRADLQRERESRAAAEARADMAEADLVRITADLAMDDTTGAVQLPRLDGMTILYVGGRPQILAALRGLAARAGAALLEHDGGVEDNDALLASLVPRADVVMFPVDCVSHRAVGVVKRGCQVAGRPYMALRSASSTAFLAGLARLEPAVGSRAGG